MLQNVSQNAVSFEKHIGIKITDQISLMSIAGIVGLMVAPPINITHIKHANFLLLKKWNFVTSPTCNCHFLGHFLRPFFVSRTSKNVEKRLHLAVNSRDAVFLGH